MPLDQLHVTLHLFIDVLLNLLKLCAGDSLLELLLLSLELLANLFGDLVQVVQLWLDLLHDGVQNLLRVWACNSLGRLIGGKLLQI